MCKKCTLYIRQMYSLMMMMMMMYEVRKTTLKLRCREIIIGIKLRSSTANFTRDCSNMHNNSVKRWHLRWESNIAIRIHSRSKGHLSPIQFASTYFFLPSDDTYIYRIWRYIELCPLYKICQLLPPDYTPNLRPIAIIIKKKRRKH